MPNIQTGLKFAFINVLFLCLVYFIPVGCSDNAIVKISHSDLDNSIESEDITADNEDSDTVEGEKPVEEDGEIDGIGEDGEVVEGIDNDDVIEYNEDGEILEVSENDEDIENNEDGEVVEGIDNDDVIEYNEDGEVVEVSENDEDGEIVESAYDDDVIENNEDGEVIESTDNDEIIENNEDGDVDEFEDIDEASDYSDADDYEPEKEEIDLEPVACVSDAECVFMNESCKAGSCVLNKCVQLNKPDNTLCDDEDFCTYSEKCLLGVCTGKRITCDSDPSVCGVKRECNGTPFCYSYYPGDASHPSDAGSCDDADKCTYNDKCTGNGTCGGTEYNCNTRGECNGDNTCACQTGYEGQYCDHCSEGYSGFPTCERIAEVRAGTNYTCALTTAGGLKCWGDSNNAHLGDGNEVGSNRLFPVNVVGLQSGVKQFAVGSSYTCAILTDGKFKCWGSNYYGDLYCGSATAACSYTCLAPVDITACMPAALQITTGEEHVCALQEGGEVKCWGSQSGGRLGNGKSQYGHISVQNAQDVIDLPSNIKQISAGYTHTCALLDNGAIKCWGFDGSTTAVDILNLIGVAKQISAGSNYTCALMVGGGVKCWGYGFLGDGNDRYSIYKDPVDVTGLQSGVKQISAGGGHTCVLMESGGVKCWGQWKGDSSKSLTPVDVPDLQNGVTQISAGSAHTCVVMNSGGIKCWGRGQEGQLGNGTDKDSATPVDVVWTH